MRHFGDRTRPWLTAALGAESVLLAALSVLAGTGVFGYHDNTKLYLIGGLAIAFGLQHSTARQFGIQELTTTVLTSTIVGLGVDSRLAGGIGSRESCATAWCSRCAVVLWWGRRSRGSRWRRCSGWPR